MGRGVIDLPMEDVVAFLEDHGRRSEWDKYLVVENYSESEGYVYNFVCM